MIRSAGYMHPETIEHDSKNPGIFLLPEIILSKQSCDVRDMNYLAGFKERI